MFSNKKFFVRLFLLLFLRLRIYEDFAVVLWRPASYLHFILRSLFSDWFLLFEDINERDLLVTLLTFLIAAERLLELSLVFFLVFCFVLNKFVQPFEVTATSEMLFNHSSTLQYPVNPVE